MKQTVLDPLLLDIATSLDMAIELEYKLSQMRQELMVGGLRMDAQVFPFPQTRLQPSYA